MKKIQLSILAFALAAIVYAQNIPVPGGRRAMSGISSTPSNGQVGVWNSTSQTWDPGTALTSSGSTNGSVTWFGESGGSVTVTNNSTNIVRISFPAIMQPGPMYLTQSGTNWTLGIATNQAVFFISEMTTALTTGTNKSYFYAPAGGMTIKGVRLTLATKSSSGTPTVDINEAGTSILSTKLTVDVDEWDSATAAAAAVISDSSIAGNAKVDFDIDVAGTGAAGAAVHLLYTVP